MTVPSPKLRTAAGGLLALLLCALPAAVPAQGVEDNLDPMARRYQLGQGLRLGDSGFRLGGYGSASYGDPTGADDWRVGLDSLSSFLWWEGGERWRFFSELEVEDAVVVQPGDTTTGHAELVLERLYFDYLRSDALKLRLGKFLTPVGRWNLIHAAPLVWTSSRPLITENTFPTNATGAMAYGLLPLTGDGVEYSVYASPGEELFPDDELDTFREAYGAHLSVSPFGGARLGFSFANFELKKTADERRTLYGADFVWSHRRWELSAEFVYRISEAFSEERDEQGLYAQAVAPLGARLYAVARYETFRRSDTSESLNLYLGGLNYRLRPAVVLKAEYSQASDRVFEVRDGFLASFAVLF
jgi:hypothetical protein